MRKEALRVMKVLRGFNPILTGSVWRGTINHNSDIDILVYNDNPLEILDILEKQGFLILQAKRVSVTKKGLNKSSYHVYLKDENRRIIEITIRNFDQKFSVRKCEVFGDKIVGLRIKDLEKIIEENPTEKFIPI